MAMEDIAEAAALITGIFVEHEPTTRAIGLGHDVFLPFVRAYCLRSVEDGTGAVVRDSGTGAMVGAITCVDILEDVRDRFPELSGPEYHAKLPDLAFVSALEHPFSQENGVVPGQCALIAQVAVAEEARGRGVASALAESACQAARSHGYEMIVAVCTTPASRQAHLKGGFQVDRTLRYDRYEYEGRHPYAGLDGECALMVKPL